LVVIVIAYLSMRANHMAMLAECHYSTVKPGCHHRSDDLRVGTEFRKLLVVKCSSVHLVMAHLVHRFYQSIQ
jgi:hypothetical protein